MKTILLLLALVFESLVYAQTATPPAAGDGSVNNPYQIASFDNLYWISKNTTSWNKHFIQTADIDASASSGISWIGIGFDSRTTFSGSYNGDGHIINNFHCNTISGMNNNALFKETYGATIQNLGLTNVVVTGLSGCALVWNLANSTIINCYSTGSVNCSYAASGLIGECRSSTITECYSTANVSGSFGYIGGLISTANNSNIERCYSTGNVIQNTIQGNPTGGFVGSNSSSTLINCYCTAYVFSAAQNDGMAAGGLVGKNSGKIINCYSSGKVASAAYFGGLVGINSGDISNSYWDMDGSGINISSGGTGKLMVEMKVRPTFTAGTWDFKGETTNGTADIWNINSNRNNGYPYLNWQYPDDGVVVNVPSLTTTAATNITTNSVIIGGNVTGIGDANVLCRGVCWSLTPDPLVTGNHISNGSGLGIFTSSITGLIPNTTYYFRAYASNSSGITYGQQLSFTTLQVLTVTTQAVSNIGSVSATGNGYITSVGNFNPTQHGVCWNTEPNPTIGNYKTQQGAHSGTGKFISSITGLKPNTTYYVRAYATNPEVTSYGEEVSFKTLLAQPSGIGTISDPYQIANIDNLYWLTQNPDQWDKQYVQTDFIDASSTNSWDNGHGFSPIGNETTYFTGSYDGKGFEIINLFINRESSYQGFFGNVSGATIKNLSINFKITFCYEYSGGLAGYAENSSISHCNSTGNTDGYYFCGGLIGKSYNSTITSCYSNAIVGSDGDLSDSQCYYHGGLVGYNELTTITDSYSKGSVFGYYYIGGLIGNNSEGSVNSSYASGDVKGLLGIGGLIGQNNASPISNCYSTGSCTGNVLTGGFIGNNIYSNISNCFSSGSVKAFGAYIGGMIGSSRSSTVTNCFWDTQTSGIGTSAMGTGKTTAQMKDQSTFLNAGWDFKGEITNGTNDYWNLLSTFNNGYPFLSWQKKGMSDPPPSEVETSAQNIPKVFDLCQNYPNPFNPVTVINYQLSVFSHTTLKIYDLRGYEVAVLVNENKQPGNYNVKLDCSNLSSGIYIYRLIAISPETGEKFVKSAKMMLLK